MFATSSSLLADDFLLHTFLIYDIVSVVLGFLCCFATTKAKPSDTVITIWIVKILNIFELLTKNLVCPAQ